MRVVVDDSNGRRFTATETTYRSFWLPRGNQKGLEVSLNLAECSGSTGKSLASCVWLLIAPATSGSLKLYVHNKWKLGKLPLKVECSCTDKQDGTFGDTVQLYWQRSAVVLTNKTVSWTPLHHISEMRSLFIVFLHCLRCHASVSAVFVSSHSLFIFWHASGAALSRHKWTLKPVTCITCGQETSVSSCLSVAQHTALSPTVRMQAVRSPVCHSTRHRYTSLLSSHRQVLVTSERPLLYLQNGALPSGKEPRVEWVSPKPVWTVENIKVFCFCEDLTRGSSLFQPNYFVTYEAWKHLFEHCLCSYSRPISLSGRMWKLCTKLYGITSQNIAVFVDPTLLTSHLALLVS
jgi:hypothetical protein